MRWREWWSRWWCSWRRRQPVAGPVATPPPEPEPGAHSPDSLRELFTTSPEAIAAGELERAARAAYRRGHYQECRELAQRALSYDASNLFAYYYLGLALAQLGLWEKAEEIYRRAQTHADTLDLSSQWLANLTQWRATGQPPPAQPAEPEALIPTPDSLAPTQTEDHVEGGMEASESEGTAGV